MSKVLKELGGLPDENTIVLKEPTPKALISSFKELNNIIKNKNIRLQRTEAVFYYSGHSDEKGLILDGGEISYPDLKEIITNISTDIKIAILDSCSSGLLIRLKGGQRLQPFLLDTSVNTKGYAFISSSSENEASQESDHILGSFFSHCLISGLRGAADMDGNGKVTLNEAYQYAFKETMAITKTYKGGSQHPSYDFQIKGAGDLVLTDIQNASAKLLISNYISGKLFIYDSSGNLVVELDKKNDLLTLGLNPGEYNIRWDKEDATFQAKAQLKDKQNSELNMNDFSVVDNNQGKSSEDIRNCAFLIQPFYSTVYGKLEKKMSPVPGVQVTGNILIADHYPNPIAIFGFQKNNADKLSMYYCALGVEYNYNIYKEIDLSMFAALGYSKGNFQLVQDNGQKKKISYSQSLFMPGISLSYSFSSNVILSGSLQAKYFIDPSIAFGTLDILIGSGYKF
jgi:hypothetical protein